MGSLGEEYVSTNPGTKVAQVTNIAPQATRDQMHALFGFIGKIEDIRLYPTVRDVSLSVQSRICYVKYVDPICVGVAQHLTNTVFIDRALIVSPYSGEIPDEYRALDIATQASIIPGLGPVEPKLPPHVVNQIEGIPPNQVIATHDPVLVSNGLPLYPPLPMTYDERRIEEIRRTLLVLNVNEAVTGEQMIDFFQKVGDVKYVRFCTRNNDSNRYALVEFSEQSSIIPGLKLNGSELAGKVIQVYHSTQAISKPMAKSNEAAQREIEEAMTRVKEAQSMISAAIDPVIGILSKDKKRSRSGSKRRSRSRSKHRRRSRSRSYHRSKHRHRSRSRSKGSKSRKSSRSRGRRRSRSRGHRRSSSKERRRSRSRGHSHRRSSYSRKRKSKERRRSKSRSRSHGRSGSRRTSKSKSRRSTSNSKSRRRSKDNSRKSNEKSHRKSDAGKSGSDRTKDSEKSKRSSRSESKRKSRSPSKKKAVSPPRRSLSKEKSRSRTPEKAKRIPKSVSPRSDSSPSQSSPPLKTSKKTDRESRSSSWRGGSSSP